MVKIVQFYEKKKFIFKKIVQFYTKKDILPVPKAHVKNNSSLWQKWELQGVRKNVCCCLRTATGFTKRCRLSLLTNSALVYESKGKVRVAGSQPISTAVHITWHGAQINFGDLPPYLTYALRQSCFFCLLICLRLLLYVCLFPHSKAKLTGKFQKNGRSTAMHSNIVFAYNKTERRLRWKWAVRYRDGEKDGNIFLVWVLSSF